MADPQFFFRTPFADAGDKTLIPNDLQPGGDVSFVQGWTPDYELEIGVNPSAKAIERQKHNDLFNKVTNSIAVLQEFGAPDWIAAADFGGVDFPYEIGARVKYTDGVTYVSLVAANIETPGTGSQWIVANTSVAVGETVLWDGPSVPTGRFLYKDGSAISRTIYAALFAVYGTTYGIGDGATTFNLPDDRGLFIRLQDNGAGVDPDAAGRTDRGDGVTGDNVGTKQDEDFLSHDHPMTAKLDVVAGIANRYSALGGGNGTTGATGGNETRPVNKYWQSYVRY